MSSLIKLSTYLFILKSTISLEDCSNDPICGDFPEEESCGFVETSEQVTGCTWVSGSCICVPQATTTQATTTTVTTTPEPRPTIPRIPCESDKHNLTSIPDECTTDVLAQISNSLDTDGQCMNKFTDCGCNKDYLPNMLIFDGINYDTDNNICCYEYTSKKLTNKNCDGKKRHDQSHIVLELDCPNMDLYNITNINNQQSSKSTIDPTSCLNGIKIDHGCSKDECKYQICMKYTNTDQCCTKLGFYNIKAGKYNIKHQTYVPSCNTTNCNNNNCTNINCNDYNFDNCPNECVAELDSIHECMSRQEAGLLDVNMIDTNINGGVNDIKTNGYKMSILYVVSAVIIGVIVMLVGIAVFLKVKRRKSVKIEKQRVEDVEQIELNNE